MMAAWMRAIAAPAIDSASSNKDKAIAKLQDEHREQAVQIGRLKEQLGELDSLSKTCKEYKDGLVRSGFLLVERGVADVKAQHLPPLCSIMGS